MAQYDDRWPSWRGLPRAARVVLIILGILAVLIAAAAIAVNLYVTPERAQTLINDQLGPATDGNYEAQLSDIRVGILGRSVTLDDLSIEPTEEMEGGGEAQASYRVEMDHFRVSGIGVLTYILHGEYSVGTIRLIRPRIHMETVESEEEASFDLDEFLAIAEEEPIRGTHVGTLRIEDAYVEGVPAEGVEAMSHTADGLSITIDDILLTPTAAEAENRFLFTRDIAVELDDYHLLMSDGIYEASLGNLSVSSRDSAVSIEALSFQPAVADSVVFAQQPWGQARYDVEMRLVDVSGLDFDTMLRDEGLHLRTVTADTLHADIFYQETEVDPPPMPFPHELVQEMQTSVAIDEVQLHHGFVQYSMAGPGVEEPGVITIEDGAVTATQLFLAPDERAEQPASLDVRGLLQGEGLVQAHIEYDLTNPDFTFDLSGTLGTMPFQAFNQMVLNVVGIRFDSGQIFEASFDLTGRASRSEAELRFMYRNLAIEIVDLIRPGFVEQLAEVIANGLLRTSTVPVEDQEDPAFVATGEAERQEGQGFGQFISAPLIDALLIVFGRDRIPV